ncbi:MAG: hypothetical protein EP330_10690 [Deltaproteobacteria bacterium]|nr:MAG: hypothetical protein EP330_10690 [Deltaproteobacteria bacterium]
MIALLLASAFGGQFLLEMDTASDAKVPVLGWQKSVTHTLALVELTEDNEWVQTVCDVEVRDKAPLARTILPDAFVSSLPVIRAKIALGEDHFEVDLGVSRVGFTEGPIPETADAPNVIDHEGDGRPGATVQVMIIGFGTYGLDVVQESRAVLHGKRDGDGWSGTLETQLLAQRVLSADHRLLAGSPELRTADERSSFTLHPTTAKSCADLPKLET